MHRKLVRTESESGSENADNQYEETMKMLKSTINQQNQAANLEYEQSKYPNKSNFNRNKVFRTAALASNPIGIVVRKEHNYVVIWSLLDGLMYAPQADLTLGTWVRYRCISGEPIENGKIAQFAYSCEDTVPLRITARLELTVQVAASISLDEDGVESDEFVSVRDEVFGTVLCSRDDYVLKRLGRGEELETFVVYAEDYRHTSYWIAVLVKRGVDDWRKMGKLPYHLDELAGVAFKRYKRTDDADDYTAQQRQTQSQIQSQQFEESKVLPQPKDRCSDEKQFGPPQNWKGVIHLTDRKISEVPGLVVEHEEEGLISVLYTAFGLARLRDSHPIGTWLMITMLEDQEEDEGEPQPTIAENYKLSYYVQRHVQIPPPMSTRVIKTEGGEKILLCGIITRGQRCLENPFIGVVDDSKQRTMPDDRLPPSSREYLVEIGLLRSIKKPKNPLFWRVLKFHGEAVGRINSVPLKDSLVSNEDNDLLHTSSRSIVGISSSARNVSESREPRKEEKTPHAYRDKPDVNSDAESISSKHSSIDSPRLKVDESLSVSLIPRVQAQSLDVAREDLMFYIPNSMEKEVRGLGIVVRKVENFAYVYSKTFGLSLLRASDCKSDEERFQFEVGQWIGASFIAAIKTDGQEKCRFKFMCLPKIVPRQAALPTRVINNFVHVEVPFVFDENKVSRCSEEPTKLRVESCLGHAIISDSAYKKLELHGTQRDFWAAYIKEKYGCSWKILTSNDISRDDQDDDLEVSIVEEDSQGDFCNLKDRELPPQLLLDFEGVMSRRPSPVRPSTKGTSEVFHAFLAGGELPSVPCTKPEQKLEYQQSKERKNIGGNRTTLSIAELALEELDAKKEKTRS